MNLSFYERLLAHYHLSEEEYLELQKNYSLDDFSLDLKFKDIELASALVKQIVASNEKIAIYGDYDADGVMGTSILVAAFKKLNYSPIYYLPNRYNDGYGITLAKAKEFVSNGVKLVITVDNGVSAFEPIAYLKENNVKVIVLDHHQIGESLPNADYIIHPQYSGFSEISSSGAFTAFMFTKELLGYFDKYLSILASISLISDMMPLLDYNRRLLRCVFSNYVIGEYPAIDLLADNEGFDENIIGMKIAPRINSIGRLIDNPSINDVVNYFVTDNDEERLNYFNQILLLNEERKSLTKEAVNALANNNQEAAIVLKVDEKEGIIGLIANNLLNKFNVPCIVFTSSEESGVLKGSARSKADFNIVEAFNNLSDLMIVSGGHVNAGGCSIKESDFEEFKKRFMDYAMHHKSETAALSEEIIPMSIVEVNRANYELVKSFSPFGEAFKAPHFVIKHIKTSTLMYSKDRKHILSQIGQNVRLVGFNFPKEEVTKSDFIDIQGFLRENRFKNFVTIEFLISSYIPSAK